MGAKMRKDPERIDPAPRLGMVLIRYSLGMFERQERRLIIEEGEEYQTRALHERVLTESAVQAATDPGQSRELAELAARIGELAGASPQVV